MKITFRPGLSAWPPLLSAALLLAACGEYAESPTLARMSALTDSLPALSAGEGDDLANILRRGLLADPQIRERAGLISASVDQIAIERAALFPQLSLGVVGGVGDAGAGDGRVELSGEQLVFDFGGTDRAIAASDIELQAQYQRFQSQIDDTVVRILTTYRKIAMMEEVVAEKIAQLAAMRELYDNINSRITIGAQSRPDLLEVNGRLERAEFELLDARLELSELRDELARLAGTDRGGPIPEFPGTCRPPQGVSGDLLLAQLEHAAAALALEEAEKAVYPGITLNPIGQLDLGTGDVTTGINLGLSTSIFNGGALSARVNQARNRLASAEAALQQAERDQQLAARRLERQTASSREKQAMLQRQIALQRETVDLYRSQYIDLGTRQITDLLDAQETLYDRRVELVQTRFDMQEHLVACAALSGTLRPTVGLTNAQLHGYPLDLPQVEFAP